MLPLPGFCVPGPRAILLDPVPAVRSCVKTAEFPESVTCQHHRKCCTIQRIHISGIATCARPLLFTTVNRSRCGMCSATTAGRLLPGNEAVSARLHRRGPLRQRRRPPRLLQANRRAVAASSRATGLAGAGGDCRAGRAAQAVAGAGARARCATRRSGPGRGTRSGAGPLRRRSDPRGLCRRGSRWSGPDPAVPLHRAKERSTEPYRNGGGAGAANRLH